MPVGIGDDATILPNGEAWSMDVLVEGVHFNERLSAEDVGFKAVAVSVSDIAAMGATPKWLMLGVSIPDPQGPFISGFTAGVAAAVEHFKLELVGGDTTRSPISVITSVVGGHCSGAPLLRSNGRSGDDLWVTGELGAAGIGWSSNAPTPIALHALRRPMPPVDFTLALAENELTRTAMDLSDGLAVDLQRLCSASRCGAVVFSEQLPLAPGATLRSATRGGEDYQLLFTADAAVRPHLQKLASQHTVKISRIGTLTTGSTAQLDSGAWPDELFAHFPVRS